MVCPSPRRSISRIPTRRSVPSSLKRSPRKPTMSLATAPQPQPCLPRHSFAKACATSLPARTPWVSSAASRRRPMSSPTNSSLWQRTSRQKSRSHPPLPFRPVAMPRSASSSLRRWTRSAKRASSRWRRARPSASSSSSPRVCVSTRATSRPTSSPMQSAWRPSSKTRMC